MSPVARVYAIFRKELTEILRDSRTLAAMLVIPVVLYPMMMLGFVRLAKTEEQRMRSQSFTIAAQNPAQQRTLQHIAQTARPAGTNDLQPDSPSLENPPPVSRQATFVVELAQDASVGFESRYDLQVSLQTEAMRLSTALVPSWRFQIVYNEVDPDSRTAMEEFRRLLNDYQEIMRREALAAILGQTPVPTSQAVRSVLDPVQVELMSVATESQRGGWVLAQIIPAILILMTITGSVYPAIDLTAGERERGTLETLMVTPISTLYLILGKFLAVAMVGIITATLNVASLGATIHFAGITHALAVEAPVQFPLSALPIVLLCMVPFALLFAAILVAVCSFARTFKEAQLYVTPVFLVALVPAMLSTLPSVELSGTMLVLPVGNMVLLARELFQQTHTTAQVVIVLVSTSLYAAAAVGVAVKLFGQEAVVFSDAGSYRTLLQRRYFVPRPTPSRTQALLLVALLFPLSFYANTALSELTGRDFLRTLGFLAIVQFTGMFVLLPMLIAWFFKIDIARTFRLGLPPASAWIAAVMLGLSSWAVAYEIFALQSYFFPSSPETLEAFRSVQAQLEAAPLWLLVLLAAIIPAVSEEFLFRGFVLSGLGGNRYKWTAIVGTAVVFAVYHFYAEKVLITAMLGVVLAYVCWQSRSIWPAILFHALHNGLLMSVVSEATAVAEWLGIAEETQASHLPVYVLTPAALLFLGGLAILARTPHSRTTPSVPPSES